jgi:phosphatidylglycerophosphate synthase
LSFFSTANKLALVVNLPNSITLGRIIVVPLLVVVLLTPISERWFGVSGYAVGIVLFLIAALTDIADGHLARKRNQV